MLKFLVMVLTHILNFDDLTTLEPPGGSVLVLRHGFLMNKNYLAFISTFIFTASYLTHEPVRDRSPYGKGGLGFLPGDTTDNIGST